MPKLYVLVGVPGSGKTTWVNNQTWTGDCVYVSTDEHVEEYAKAVGKTYSEVFEEAMPNALSEMINTVLWARDNNYDIVWDQTSTTVNSRAKKFRMLPEYYKIAVYFPTPEAHEWRQRLDNRPGKVIPQEVLDQMVLQLELPSKEEGFDEVWVAQS